MSQAAAVADVTTEEFRANWRARVARDFRGTDRRVLLALMDLHERGPRCAIAICSLAARAAASDAATRRAVRRARDAGLIATEPMRVDMGGYYRMVNHFTFWTGLA
jgi:hypothetical protein